METTAKMEEDNSTIEFLRNAKKLKKMQEENDYRIELIEAVLRSQFVRRERVKFDREYDEFVNDYLAEEEQS
mgnify:CR=1 FL=1